MNTINPLNQDHSKFFLITIDVEDWFQVENFKSFISYDSWNVRKLRVEKNVQRLLDLFDNVGATHQCGQWRSRDTAPIKATFFVLGWIAKQLPHLIREIYARGHEIASHGSDHDLPNRLGLDKLKNDLIASRKTLEDIIGFQIRGYRAPSFAINDRVLRIIEECGYVYDSSYNSFALHRRYGRISVNDLQKCRVGYKLSEDFYELPISNININLPFGKMLSRSSGGSESSGRNLILPLGGGGYFRILPYTISKLCIRRNLKEDAAFVFYLHPWEIDPEQPRVTGAPLQYRFRHYTNLNTTYGKLKRLIMDFRSVRFVICTEFIDEVIKNYCDTQIEKMN